MAGSFVDATSCLPRYPWCTQQWPGLETEAAMSGEPAGPGWQLGEPWMPWALAVKPSSCPNCLVLPSLSTMDPYSWLGKGELEPKGSWVPWNRVCMGRRKEREHGGKWFACCPDAMILSLGDFRAFHCGHLKAGSSCKALAAPVGLWLASSQKPQQRAHFGGVHAVHMLSAHCEVWPWS